MKKRHTVRAILFDSDNRTYLTKIKPSIVSEKGTEGIEPFWVTVGGGIEKGESAIEALKREIQEETGLTDIAIFNKPCWQGEIVLMCNGEPVLFCEQFFIVKTNDIFVSTAGLQVHEQEELHDHRWWSMSELISSNKIFVPRNIGTLLSDLIQGQDNMYATKTINLSINLQ